MMSPETQTCTPATKEAEWGHQGLVYKTKRPFGLKTLWIGNVGYGRAE